MYGIILYILLYTIGFVLLSSLFISYSKYNLFKIQKTAINSLSHKQQNSEKSLMMWVSECGRFVCGVWWKCLVRCLDLRLVCVLIVDTNETVDGWKEVWKLTDLPNSGTLTMHPCICMYVSMYVRFYALFIYRMVSFHTMRCCGGYVCILYYSCLLSFCLVYKMMILVTCM